MNELTGDESVSADDPYQLKRFLAAQENDYRFALSELNRGLKESHWIWYIFPQVAGLGRSSMAEKYAIGSLQEGKAYLDHDVLGARLYECVCALLKHQGRNIEDIMGIPDNMKLQSSMTLFAFLSTQDSVFHQLLRIFYAGEMDPKTLAFFSSSQ